MGFIGSLLLTMGACEETPTSAGAGAGRVGGRATAPVSVEIATGRWDAPVGTRIVVEVSAGTEEAAAAEGEVAWDPRRLQFVGQLPDRDAPVVVNDAARERGELEFVTARLAGADRRLALFVFEVLAPGYEEALHVGIRTLLSPSGDVIPTRGSFTVVGRGALPPSDGARRLSLHDWVEYVMPGAVLEPGLAGRGSPSRVPGASNIFGDGTGDGVVNVLDVLYVANLSVGNRSAAECILGTDAPMRDCVAVNVHPANAPGLGEPGDPCPPGIESACAGDLRVINVLDVLAVAQESVGHDQPVVGEAVPKTGIAVDTVVLSGVVTGSRTLYADTLYRLLGDVFVGADTVPSELLIQSGVRIEGTAGSALVVTRGGRILAEGTRIRPIVMTCTEVAAPGCWEGVVIHGNAQTHSGLGTSPAVPGRASGGCAQQASAAHGGFGGCENADSSGVLRHVRIEYAGSAGAALELRGVGSSTVLEHLYVHRSQVTGLALTGGTAGVRYLRATGNQSMGLSWQGGWTGLLQYAAIQSASTGLVAIDGANDSTNPDGLPRSAPHLRNVTVVGPPMQGVGFGAGAIRLRDGTDATLGSLLMIGQPTPDAYVLDIDGAESWARFDAGAITLTESLIVGYGRLGDLDPDDATAGPYRSPDVEGQYLRDPALDNEIIVSFADVEDALYGPWETVPDLRVESGSAAGAITCGAVTGDPFFEPVNHCGAIPLTGPAVVPWLEPAPLFNAPRIPSDPQPGYLEYLVYSSELGALPGVTVSGPTTGVTGLDGLYRSYTTPGPFVITLSGLPSGCQQPFGPTILQPPASLEEATADTYVNLGILVDCSGAVP